MGAQRITRHEGARYKVMGVDSDLWETLTHIRYTCEHVRFLRPIVRDDANHVIFRATPLLLTATSSRLRHSPVRIAPSTQRESLQPSPSGPAVAHTARRKMASKPPRQPPRGESRKSPLRCVNKAYQAALGHDRDFRVFVKSYPNASTIQYAECSGGCGAIGRKGSQGDS